MFELFITGTPIPQGSKTGYVINGKAVLVDSNKQLKFWRSILMSNIRDERENRGIRFAQPVKLECTFYMPQAKSNKKEFMTQKPDLDKLLRAVLDSATDAELIPDDSWVTTIIARKVWAAEWEGVHLKFSMDLGQHAEVMPLPKRN